MFLNNLKFYTKKYDRYNSFQDPKKKNWYFLFEKGTYVCMNINRGMCVYEEIKDTPLSWNI